MKKLLTIILFFTCRLCFGQNLVPNPSFEDTFSTQVLQPYMYNLSGITLDGVNFIYPKHWVYATQSVDYDNSCDTTKNQSVPNNLTGYRQDNKGGKSYIGIICRWTQGWLNYREILGVQLLDSLKIGIKYFASMDVSLADSSNCGIDKVGLLFSTLPYDSITLHNYAQVYSHSLLINHTGWTTLNYSFIADSNYKYVYVGNFFDDAHTDTTIITSHPNQYMNLGDSPNECAAYYLIDNVCVSSDSLTCNSPVGINEATPNDNASCYPNPFSNQLTFRPTNNEQTTVYLYNFLGHRILNKTFTNSTTINTEQFADGIYFYELHNNKRTIKNGKLIKQ